MSTQHQTLAYRDGHKWIVYCIKCGQEEPIGECSEKYVMFECLKLGETNKAVDLSVKSSYVSGIAKLAF